jgi:four helix bundle protein
MEQVDVFEKLIAWQKARALNKRVYEVTRKGDLAKDFGLIRQMQRASVSIMANIAEGFERNRLTEFHQFLSISKSSCGELRSHFYAALDVGLLESTTFEELREMAVEVSRIISGLRSSIERQIKQKNN